MIIFTKYNQSFCLVLVFSCSSSKLFYLHSCLFTNHGNTSPNSYKNSSQGSLLLLTAIRVPASTSIIQDRSPFVTCWPCTGDTQRCETSSPWKCKVYTVDQWMGRWTDKWVHGEMDKWQRKISEPRWEIYGGSTGNYITSLVCLNTFIIKFQY